MDKEFWGLIEDAMVQLEFPSLIEQETAASELLLKALGVVPAYVG